MQNKRKQFAVLRAVGLAFAIISWNIVAQSQSQGRVYGTVYLNHRPVGNGDARVFVLNSSQGDSLESCLRNGSNFARCYFTAMGGDLLHGLPTDSGGHYSFTNEEADGTYWFVAVYKWGDMSSDNPIHALKFTAVQEGHEQQLDLFMPGQP